MMKPIGFDVSHWNGVVDWEKHKKAGNVFAFAKATEGINFIDQQYARNREEATKVDILFGGYHFFRPGQDAMAQADLFLRTVGKTTLPPVLDWETSDHVRTQVQIQKAKIWLKAVEEELKVTPLIYGSPYFLRDLGLTADFKRYPLWIAHYGVAAPKIPTPWHEWTFWQTSDASGLDTDLYQGSLEDLIALGTRRSLLPVV